MNRRELIRHLRNNGCDLVREGANHTIWLNPKNGLSSAVPRHQVVKRNTIRKICKELGIEAPTELSG